MKKESLFRADLHIHHIRELPLDLLWQQGIRGLLFDLDNTVTAWRSLEVAEETRCFFAALQQRGFRVAIVSNSDRARVAPVGELLDVLALSGAGKPSVRTILHACDQLGLSPGQTAFVGDQLLTDILGANRAGLTSILTDVVHPKEFWGTRYLSRWLERLIHALLLRKINERKQKAIPDFHALSVLCRQGIFYTVVELTWSATNLGMCTP